MRIRKIGFNLAIAILVFSHPARAGWFSKPEQPRPERPAAYNISVDPQADQEANAQMGQFEKQMEDEFKNIEASVKAGDTQTAMTKAQRALDQVGILLGVDPKAKLTKKYYVNLRFPEGATSLNDLGEEQRIAVISQFRFFRGGYFLDVLNLAKQTSMQYAQAVVARLQASGQFTPEIRAKLIRDLLIAKLMPIPLVDNADQAITVFLDEIANENHTFLFDLDIETYLLTDSNFKLSKAEFGAELEKVKAPFIFSERRKAIDEKRELMLQSGLTCMNIILHVPLFDRKGDWGQEQKSAREQVNACFNQYYKQVGNQQRCLTLVDHLQLEYRGMDTTYDYMPVERASARLKCHDWYNNVKWAEEDK